MYYRNTGMETFLEVLGVIFNNIEQYDKLYLLDNITKCGLISFMDCINLLAVSKSVYNFIKSITYLGFNINQLDFRLYLKIKCYGSKFLFYVFDYDLVKLFLSKFGYVYTDIQPIYEYDSDTGYGYSNICSYKEPDHIKNYYRNTCNNNTIHYISENIIEYKASPLHIMASENRYQIAIACILYNADINKLDAVDRTVLSVSVRFSYTITKYILENCTFNINHKQIYDLSPLHNACSGNNIQIVKMLLACGAEINLVDFWDKTPIFYALESPDIVELLAPIADLTTNILQHLNDYCKNRGKYLYNVPYRKRIDASEKILLNYMKNDQ